MPVSPAPDFNLELWLASLDTIAAWQPRRLFSTHYGFSADPTRHLALLRAGLQLWADTARQLLATEAADPDRALAFERFVTGWLAGKASDQAIATCAAFSDFKASWYGLARYWRKKAELAA